jgi:hypothetical protein
MGEGTDSNEDPRVYGEAIEEMVEEGLLDDQPPPPESDGALQELIDEGVIPA